MKNKIYSRIKEIEVEENIRVLYACESGSRAWGFPSANSDYDVRFIYIRPINWYLSVEPGKDVIEYKIKDNLDINGWDLKKALPLLRKTNPPLLEWLGSPIVYYEKYSVTQKMRELANKYHSSSAYFFHYFHMANGNFREYLQGESVWVKKYFYVLRPLLAMKWVEDGRGIVPTDFNFLLESLDLHEKLKTEIRELVKRKQEGDELEKGKRIELISNFIEEEVKKWNEYKIEKSSVLFPLSEIENLFYDSIKEVWGEYDPKNGYKLSI